MAKTGRARSRAWPRGWFLCYAFGTAWFMVVYARSQRRNRPGRSAFDVRDSLHLAGLRQDCPRHARCRTPEAALEIVGSGLRFHNQAHFSGVQRFFPAVRIAHDQRAVFIDVYGQGAPFVAVFDKGHFVAQRQGAGAVFRQEAACAQIGGEIKQPDGDFGGQAVAGDGLRVQRSRARGEFLGKSARVHVYADAHAYAAERVHFKAAAGFGEDAAELFAVQIDVVDPLDLANAAAQRLHRLRTATAAAAVSSVASESATRGRSASVMYSPSPAGE